MPRNERMMAGKPRSNEGLKNVPESTENDADVAEALRVMIAFLEGVQEESRTVEARLGTSAFDFSRALSNLKYAQVEKSIKSVPALCEIVFEYGIPPKIMRTMCDGLKVTFPEGRDLDSYIADRFFGKPMAFDANPDFKIDREQRIWGGRKWMDDLVQKQLDADHIDLETAHQIQAIARDVSNTYGSAAAATARLIFMCSRNESMPDQGREEMSRSIERFRLLVMARTAEDVGIKPGEKHFFDMMRSFLGVYSDITTKVVRHAKEHQKGDIERRSEAALSRFLQSERLRVAQFDKDPSAIDPFASFSEMLSHEKTNPWVMGDGRDTPFDAGKFHRLITKDVPRGLVADAAFFLENYKEALFIQEIHQLLEEIEVQQEKSLTPSAHKTGIPKQLEKKIHDAVDKILLIEARKADFADNTARIKALEEFASRQSRSLSAFSVLMRIVDPEKVVKDANLKQEFKALVESVGDFATPGADYRKIQILGSSVDAFLESTDPYLDVPLLGIKGNPSIRLLLTNRSEGKWFDEEVLEKGPYVHTKEANKPPEKPLITPRDLLGLSEEEIERAKMNFNTAKGGSWILDRKWIIAAGETMSRLPNSYKNILRFARSEADFHWRNSGEYVTAFHPSASEAMADVVRSLLPPITDRDYIITTHQEYDSMTAPFREKGATVFAVHCNIRGEEGEIDRAKSPEEIFEEFKSIVEREQRLRDGRPPLAFLASDKTRLGDATAVVPLEKRMRTRKGESKEVEVGERTPNSLGLAALNKMIGERYANTRIFTDSSQSAGRNDRSEDLNILSCDVLFATGGKAIGVKGVSVTMIRKTPESKPHDVGLPSETTIARDYIAVGSETPEEYWKKIWRDPLSRLTPEKGTINTAGIAAFGIALQHLNSSVDTWGMRRSGTREKKQTQRDMIADHNGELTSHMIMRAEGYDSQLLNRLKNESLPFSIPESEILTSDPEVQKQFGCRVIYPVHRKKVDYTFCTLTFPNLGSFERKMVSVRGGTAEREVPVRGTYLLRSLEKLGIPAEQCMLGGNGVRFSFNNTQTKRDVDKLFVAIINTHVAFLRREIENKSIKDWAGLKEGTPKVEDKEWVED